MDWLRWILLLIGAAIVAAIWWSGYRHGRARGETLFERARRNPEDGAEAPADEVAESAAPDGRRDAPDLDVSSFEPFAVDETVPDLEIGRDEPRVWGGKGKAVVDDAEPEAAGEAAPAQPAARRDAPGRSSAADASPERTAASGGSDRKESPDTQTEPAGEERVESVLVVAAGGERLVGSRLQALFSRHGLRHGEMDIYHLHDPEGHVLFSVANLVEPGTFDPATMDTLSTPGVALFVRLPGPPSAEVAFDRMIATARSLAEELDARVLDRQQSTLTRQTEQHLRDAMREYDHRHRRGRA